MADKPLAAMPAPAAPSAPSSAAAHPPRLLPSDEDLQRLPASERIRYRLVTADRRYHANDNIAPFVRAGELAELKAEVAEKLQEVLKSLVIDTDSDHNTQDTARRVARMYIDEVFAGRYRPPPAVTEFPNAERLNELMIVGPITVRSAWPGSKSTEPAPLWPVV